MFPTSILIIAALVTSILSVVIFVALIVTTAALVTSILPAYTFTAFIPLAMEPASVNFLLSVEKSPEISTSALPTSTPPIPGSKVRSLAEKLPLIVMESVEAEAPIVRVTSSSAVTPITSKATLFVNSTAPSALVIFNFSTSLFSVSSIVPSALNDNVLEVFITVDGFCVILPIPVCVILTYLESKSKLPNSISTFPVIDTVPETISRSPPPEKEIVPVNSDK